MKQRKRTGAHGSPVSNHAKHFILTGEQQKPSHQKDGQARARYATTTLHTKDTSSAVRSPVNDQMPGLSPIRTPIKITSANRDQSSPTTIAMNIQSSKPLIERTLEGSEGGVQVLASGQMKHGYETQYLPDSSTNVAQRLAASTESGL